MNSETWQWPSLRCATLAFCLLSCCVSPVAAADEVKIHNLYDAFGEAPGMTRHFGFSALIEYGDLLILFDAGADADLFANHLKAAGFQPEDIDLAVASHRHWDHISGFDYLLERNPDVPLFLPADFELGTPAPANLGGREPEIAAELPPEQRYFGGDLEGQRLTSSGRFRGAKVEFVRETRTIAPGVTLVPTESALLGGFSRYPPHTDEPQVWPLPELSLSLSTETGQLLIVGCSHSTVDAIVQATREEIDRPIRLLLGGYHLMPYDREAIRMLARTLHDERGIAHVAPAHCTGHLAFKLFQEQYGDDYLFFGLGTTLVVDAKSIRHHETHETRKPPPGD